jgi:hypothetical protein
MTFIQMSLAHHLCPACSLLQLPDEKELLMARLKAEAAKQKQRQLVQGLAAPDGGTGPSAAASGGAGAGGGQEQRPDVVVEMDGVPEAVRMPVPPITLVFKDLR